MRLKDKVGLSPGEVARRIKSERSRLGLTQDATAKALGITRSSYVQLESVANPQASRLVQLVRIGFRLEAILPELFPESEGPDDAPDDPAADRP